MRYLSIGRTIGLIGVCWLLVIGVGMAEQPVDRTLPEYTGVPMPEPAPWTGLEGGGVEIRGLVDDFNRPDGPLGPDWTVQLPSMSIVGEAATGTNNALATHNSATGDSVEADLAIDPAGGLQYAALTLNYGGGNTSIFVKVQNQGGGAEFDTFYCYIGNNGSGGSFGVDGSLVESFSSAHMAVSVDGSRDVTINLTNIDGGAVTDQQYICTNAPAAEGPGVGIGVYGVNLVRIDNFGAEVVPVELMSLSVE